MATARGQRKAAKRTGKGPRRKRGPKRSVYKSAIITFIDILGFRDLVAKRPAAEVGTIIDTVRHFSADPKKADPLGLRVITFSDSVIRYRSQSTLSGIFYELLDLMHAQAELIGRGVLVRGGVSFGKLAWDSDKVFGPGFIDAYDLESKVAVYPRIAVSPSLLSALATAEVPVAPHHSIADECGYVQKLLAQGDDGVWFIDYLRAFSSEVDEPEQYLDYLDDHRRLIVSLTESLQGTSSSLSSLALKANWLAKYHNAVAAEIGEHDLLLPKGCIPSLFSFDDVR